MQHAPDYLRRTDLSFATPGQKGPWNTNFPPKFWRDPAALGQISSSTYNGVGPTEIQKFVIPAAQWDFNIPPVKVDYPSYVVESTQANIGGSPINPQKLSTRDQANAISAELGFTGINAVQERVLPGFPVNYGSEIRRIWLIISGNLQFVVGDLLAMQNEFGVGAPGHWNPVGYSWVPDPNETVIPKDPPVQVPLRNLRSGETIVQVLGGWVVEDGIGVVTPQGGGDGNSDQLARIESKLDKLLSAVGVQ